MVPPGSQAIVPMIEKAVVRPNVLPMNLLVVDDEKTVVRRCRRAERYEGYRRVNGRGSHKYFGEFRRRPPHDRFEIAEIEGNGKREMIRCGRPTRDRKLTSRNWPCSTQIF